MYKIVRGLFFATAAIFAVTAFTAATPVLAQDAKAAIEKRKMAMKGFGGHFKAISAFIKQGEGSAEDIAKRAAEISASAKMLPSLFPAKSGMDMVNDPKTRALAMIWTDKAKFDSFAATLGVEAAKLEKVAMTGDKAAIQAQMGMIGKNVCGACHATFRAKSN